MRRSFDGGFGQGKNTMLTGTQTSSRPLQVLLLLLLLLLLGETSIE